MLYGIRFVVPLIVILSIVACQSPVSTQPAAPTAAQIAESYTAQPDWGQTSWEAGPGYADVQKPGGYWSSGGIRVLPDGTITLSHQNAASDDAR